MKYQHLLTFLAIVLAGCASTQDLREGNSIFGGFVDTQIGPGLYEMRATGEFAMATWNKRADQLCGRGQHQALQVSARRDVMGTNDVVIGRGIVIPIQSTSNSLNGYVLCNSSSMQKAQAVKYIESLPELRRKELEDSLRTDLAKLGGADCGAESENDSAETYYERGKLLMGHRQHKPALTCLLKAVSYGPKTPIYRQVCEIVGEIFELGLGVPVDKAAAWEWYTKAGLL
jgi:hypothetical protein